MLLEVICVHAAQQANCLIPPYMKISNLIVLVPKPSIRNARRVCVTLETVTSCSTGRAQRRPHSGCGSY
jgi:hypothetical protein